MSTVAQRRFHAIAPDLNPAGVEAIARLQHGRIAGLSDDTLRDEIEVSRRLEVGTPGTLRNAAEISGLLPDYLEWENENVRTL